MHQQGKDKKMEISARQSACMIASTAIGAGVLSLPRSAAELANQSGWYAVLLSTVLAMAIVSVMTILIRRFPKASIIEFSRDILGIGNNRVVGYILSFPLLALLLLYWVACTVLSARLFGEVVVTTLLPTTPLEVIVGTMLFTGFFLTFYNVEVLARVNELFLPLIAVAVLLIAISSFQQAQSYRLFPLREDILWGELFLTVFQIFSTSLLGFEVMLLFSEYIRQSPNLVHSHVGGILIPGMLYTLITIAGIAVFGSEELGILMWPTLELVKMTEVPGLILERIESAFIGVWVAAVFTTTGNFYYAVCLMLKKLFRLKSQRLIGAALLPVFYWMSLQPRNIHVLFEYVRYVTLVGGIYIIGVPILLLVLAWVRKKGAKGAAVS